MESVYIETTVISYLVTRRQKFECYISQIVIDEIQAGDNQAAEKRMRLSEEKLEQAVIELFEA